MIQPGKVYLVGAGPGHPELLTLKAAELLTAGDVIVYDRLIQEEVLALAKPSAERIYMGKPVGKHESRQDEIHQLLLRKAREGKVVVRLKGGDPFVFGRGGEEAEFLAEHDVPFEVIPGVSSALAAPLSAGIAVTHRSIASAVAIVTGHEANEEHSRLDWNALSKLDTLVFLMALRGVDRIARKLIESGRDPGTPAAMIQMAFWHDERVVTGTLGSIAEEVKRANLGPPATLVVGEAVCLREKLQKSQRDLRRNPDDSSRFQPAPAPDQLLRLAAAGLGSQVLRFAVALSLFDHLENWTPVSDLARVFGLNTTALLEILNGLVALGLLESGPEGYRNLEMSSRYLRSDSPQSLKPTLLYQTAQADQWEALARYVLNGRCDTSRLAFGSEALYADSCEHLARFVAPSVVEKIDLSSHQSLLVVGWGKETYREALARRWPHLKVHTTNPFCGPRRCSNSADTLASGNGTYGAVLLSGLLASCERGEVQTMLQEASAVLEHGGLLALHDSFLPSEELPPPEVVLGALGRHITRGGCRHWSTDRLATVLASLGFVSIQPKTVPAGTVVVTARKENGISIA